MICNGKRHGNAGCVPLIGQICQGEFITSHTHSAAGNQAPKCSPHNILVFCDDGDTIACNVPFTEWSVGKNIGNRVLFTKSIGSGWIQAQKFSLLSPSVPPILYDADWFLLDRVLSWLLYFLKLRWYPFFRAILSRIVCIVLDLSFIFSDFDLVVASSIELLKSSISITVATIQ